jgi:hypothetical protein
MIRTPFRVRRHGNPNSMAEVTVVHLCSPVFFDTTARGFVPKGRMIGDKEAERPTSFRLRD